VRVNNTLGYPRWCICRYTLGGVYAVYPGGMYLLYTLGMYPTVHPWVCTLLYTPGYTPVYHRPAHHWVHCSTAADVQGDVLLGSKREKPLGGKRERVLKS